VFSSWRSKHHSTLVVIMFGPGKASSIATTFAAGLYAVGAPWSCAVTQHFSLWQLRQLFAHNNISESQLLQVQHPLTGMMLSRIGVQRTSSSFSRSVKHGPGMFACSQKVAFWTKTSMGRISIRLTSRRCYGQINNAF
jgi:hypothetical protein